jgi:hypothetical protein
MQVAGKLSFPLSPAENYQRLVKRAVKTKWEDRFRVIIKGLGAPPWVEQYRFDSVRLWRFDFAWPERKIAFEMEGAIWMRGGGGHSHPLGIEKDIEKYNAAAIQGWAVIRITDKMLRARTLFRDEAAQLVIAAFKLDPARLSIVG